MTTGSEQVEVAEDRAVAFVVEDVEEDGVLIGKILSDAGYEPVITDNSRGALEAAVEAGPRFIVLSADVNKGFNLCHRMKKEKKLDGVPIILVAAKARPDVISKHKMLPTRADAYLDKPLEAQVLIETIDKLLAEAEEIEVEELSEDDIVRTGEIDVNETLDRTLVNQGIDSAVVTYVEDEMNALKDMVTRLESEKGGLIEKVKALESQLIDDHKRIDSSLRVLMDRQQEQSASFSMSAVAADGSKASADETGADTEVLKARIETLEKEAEAAREVEESLRAEVTQTTILFERLEAGYKESLATAEARREAAENTAAEAEQTIDDLKRQVETLEASLEELPSLREMAARAEMLEEDFANAKNELDELRAESEGLAEKAARVEELEKSNEDLSGAREEFEAAKADLEARIAELTGRNEELENANAELNEQVKTLTARIDELENSRHAAEQTAEFARAEVSEMRDRFNKLKSIIGDVSDSSSQVVENPAAVLEDSIELVDNS